MSAAGGLPPLNVSVDYLEAYGSWCSILHCPDGCECGQRSVVPGFASREAAQAWTDEMVAGWPGSEQARQLRDRMAGPG